MGGREFPVPFMCRFSPRYTTVSYFVSLFTVPDASVSFSCRLHVLISRAGKADLSYALSGKYLTHDSVLREK